MLNRDIQKNFRVDEIEDQVIKRVAEIRRLSQSDLLRQLLIAEAKRLDVWPEMNVQQEKVKVLA